MSEDHATYTATLDDNEFGPQPCLIYENGRYEPGELPVGIWSVVEFVADRRHRLHREATFHGGSGAAWTYATSHCVGKGNVVVLIHVYEAKNSTAEVRFLAEIENARHSAPIGFRHWVHLVHWSARILHDVQAVMATEDEEEWPGSAWFGTAG